MANLTLDVAQVGAADPISADKLTLPAGASTLVAGDLVRIDTSTGKFVLAKATTAPNGRVYGMLVNGADRANCPVTAIRRGVVALDDSALSGLAYDAPVYLSDTDGKAADAAGTVSVVIGRVIPLFANSGTAKKLLKIEL